jgi:hypothetical protein
MHPVLLQRRKSLEVLRFEASAQRLRGLKVRTQTTI